MNQADRDVVKQGVIDDTATPHTKSEREHSKAASDLRNGQSELSMGVRVYSPYRTYYEGAAFSVSAVNDTGPFDILPQHHNFISLLTACELVVRSIDGGEQKIAISGGIMHVKADKVIVFLDV